MSNQERTKKAYALLTILATVPAFVFDIVDYKLFGEYRLHPMLVEQLLVHRNQFDGALSISENIERHYGQVAASLAEELI